MKTVFDVKKALDPDLMVNMVNEYQKQKRQPVQRKRKVRNKWENVFPIWKGVK